jgi:hypothetical protein
MRVLCIDDKPNSGTPNPVWRIKFGEIYEVISERMTEWGIAWELDIHPGYGYWPEHFAPLSDIDETELATRREEVSV